MAGDPVAFARATMMFYAINLILSVMLLSRVATGRWSVWPAFSGLLVYNASFIWGFQNFVFTVPFSIHALTLWLIMERQSTAWRVAVFLPISVVLFLMHLLAFGALAAAALGREIHRLIEKDTMRREGLTRFLASGIPFFLPLLWYVYLALSQPGGELGSRTEFGGWSQRLHALVSVQWERPLNETPALLSTGMIILIVFWISFLTLLLRVGPRLQMADSLKGPVLALLTLSILAPSWLNGVALIHIRFPVVAVALLFAGTSWIEMSLRNGAILTVVFAALFGLKSHQLEKHFAMHNAEMNELTQVLSEIPQGSRLLPLRASGYEGVQRLWHVQAYGTTYNDVFVPTFFQGSHSVKLRSEWSSYAAAAYRPVTVQKAFQHEQHVPVHVNAYWIDWETKFTHVLFLDEMHSQELRTKDLRFLKSVGRFTLFHLNNQTALRGQQCVGGKTACEKAKDFTNRGHDPEQTRGQQDCFYRGSGA
jgi:hypothetical protein